MYDKKETLSLYCKLFETSNSTALSLLKKPDYKEFFRHISQFTCNGISAPERPGSNSNACNIRLLK